MISCAFEFILFVYALMFPSLILERKIFNTNKNKTKKQMNIHIQKYPPQKQREQIGATKKNVKQNITSNAIYKLLQNNIFHFVTLSVFIQFFLCKCCYIYLVVPYFNTLLLISYALWMIHRQASEYTCKFICACDLHTCVFCLNGSIFC